MKSITELSPIFLLDGYKVDHRRQYPEKTTTVYSNFTPRKSRVPGQTDVVMFGLQYFVMEYLIHRFNEYFFYQPRSVIEKQYKRRMDNYLHKDAIPVNHIAALHELGYLPLWLKALPEGTLCPTKVPMLTLTNTVPEFFWLTNSLETLLSNTFWKMCTSATTAFCFRKQFEYASKSSGYPLDIVKFQGHDFSFRGMSFVEDALASGAAHLTSFVGTDTIPAIDFLEHYYGADSDTELVGCSVPATEHSVASLGILDKAAYLQQEHPEWSTEECRFEAEVATLRRLITEVYPKGLVSYVADTYDFWQVVTRVVSRLKPEIMGREGSLVCRPDCYDDQTEIMTADGWKLFSKLTENDAVVQVTENQQAEYVKPLEIIAQDYTGPMYHFKDRKGKVDLLVTPEHRMVWEFTNTAGEVTVQTEPAEKTKVGMCYRRLLRTVENVDKGEHLSWLDRLRIAFQADGAFQSKHAKTINPGQTTGKVCIRFAFTKQRKIDRLAWLCRGGGFEFTTNHEESRPGQVVFYVWVPVEANLQKNLDWVPRQADLCGGWCRMFIDEVSHWDAHRRSTKRFKYDSTIADNTETVQRVALAAGYGCLTTQYTDDRKAHFKDTHTANILLDNHIGGQAITKTQVNYSGKVYCVKVPSGKILVKRNRATAVSGNSGDPTKVVCGDDTAPVGSPEHKGAVQCLWDVFGGKQTAKNYNELDSHIGLIYGDAITREIQRAIIAGLLDKGFAPAIVLGMGSYSYQYVTRDTFGFAMKATYGVVDGKPREIYKDPKTDRGSEKKSARGLLAVFRNEQNDLTLYDNCTPEMEAGGLLTPVFRDGHMLRRTTLADVRTRLHGSNF